MVVKSKKKSAGKGKNVKVLNLKKETVKNLTGGESKRIKGGDSNVYPVIQVTPSMTSSGVMSVISRASASYPSGR